MAKGNPSKVYSAQQISAVGCGDVSYIRKELKKRKISHACIRRVEGQKTKFYPVDQLPPAWQAKIERHEFELKLKEYGIDPTGPVNMATVEESAIAYADAAAYNRRKADKYLMILDALDMFKGKELEEKIAEWNQQHPDMKTSYKSFMREQKRVREQGTAALIGKHGKRKGTSIIPDEPFYHYWSMYGKQGGPSSASSWRATMGKFCQGGCLDGFPSEESFLRRARLEIGESAIYYARHGFAKWNRKYASYTDRDYTKLAAGEVFVSDHAQVDVMLKGPDGKPGCGWITSFMDMKTGKVLSSFFHMEAPNSDHIFQAFYMAAERFGLPDYVYIDNGKDYRARDFAGGRLKVTVDEKRLTPMLLKLGVKPIFSLPYNAPAKTIERMHLKIKQGLSMLMPGYRGGNVVERPEKLAGEIKEGALLEFAEFRAHLYDWIENVLNKMPSKGKALQGKSPNDAWNLENPVKRTVSKEALRLFCMRTTRPLTIRRNGVADSFNGVTYFAEWMTPHKGRKVYLRRAVEDFNDAWVFDSDTDEYMGSAGIAGTVAAIAKTPLEKQQLKDAMAAKRREHKAVKAAGVVKPVPSVTEIINNQKAATALLNPEPVPEPKRTVAKIGRTAMDDAVNQRRKSEQPADTRKPRIAAELEHARKQLDYHKNRLIAYPSEKAEKKQAIEHWTGEVARIEAEWRDVG